MKLRFIDLNRMPDDTADGGADNSTDDKQNPGAEPQPGGAEKPKEKGFLGKIKDALQEWSNNDQKEQEEDDATP